MSGSDGIKSSTSKRRGQFSRRGMLEKSAAVGTLAMSAAWLWKNVLPENVNPYRSNPNQANTPSESRVPTDTPLSSISEGLISHWKFDGEGTGTTVLDSAGSNHGTLNGATHMGSEGPKMGGAYYFDGIDDDINLPDSLSGFDPDSPVTLSFWIKSDFSTVTENDDDRAISFRKGYSLGFLHNQSLDPTISVQDENGNGITVTDNNPTNQWTNYAATYNGSDLVLWKNGSKIDENTGNGMRNDGGTNEFGNQRGGSNNHFKGYLTNIRVYNRVLSDAELSNIYGNRI